RARHRQPRAQPGARGRRRRRRDPRADAAAPLRGLPRDAGLLLRQADAGGRVHRAGATRNATGAHGLQNMTTGNPAEASAFGRHLRLPAPLQRLGARLRARPDSEHEMIFNRLVIAVLITSYLLVALWFDVPDVHEPLVVSAVFSACSIAFFLHLIMHPGVSVARRFLAMVVDLGMLSWGMHVGDEITSLLYPMYLWTIFGNGFRFGVR